MDLTLSLLILYFVYVNKVTSIGFVHNTYGDGRTITVQRRVGDPESVVFKIAACRDAILYLCKPFDGQDQCIYKVEIGGTENTKSTISNKDQVTVAVALHSPLNCETALPFWLRWDLGTLSVGMGTDVNAMQFLMPADLDSSISEVDHLLLATGFGVDGEWTFDQESCTPDLCLNGGTCANILFGDYSCTCSNGFAGKNCERAEDKLTYEPCSENDETCKNVFDGFYLVPIYARTIDNENGGDGSSGGRKKRSTMCSVENQDKYHVLEYMDSNL